MIIPEAVRRSVLFVCARTAVDAFQPIGTAFTYGRSIPGTEFAMPLIFTAKHVVVKASQQSIDGQVHLRFNMTAGGAATISTDPNAWLGHETDSSVDAMAIFFSPETIGADCVVLPDGMVLSDDLIREKQVGPGEDVFLAGLFVNHAGREHNIPVIRLGSIAAMPEEKVQTRHFGAMDAYLIEVRSIGGFSGSPVFVYIDAFRPSPGGGVTYQGGVQLHLLGLMHGYFGLRDDEETGVAEETGGDPINSGIAAVVPVSKLVEIASHSTIDAKMAEQRDRIDEREG